MEQQVMEATRLSYPMREKALAERPVIIRTAYKIDNRTTEDPSNETFQFPDDYVHASVPPWGTQPSKRQNRHQTFAERRYAGFRDSGYHSHGHCYGKFLPSERQSPPPEIEPVNPDSVDINKHTDGRTVCKTRNQTGGFFTTS